MTRTPVLPFAAHSLLQPPDRLTVAEWADRHRVLDPIYTPGEPGPYSSARTPYLVGIWDAWTDASIRQITFLKSTQVGGTEALMNLVGFTIAEDPGPIMLVMPTQEDAREIKDRVGAMVDSSPALAQFRPQSKSDDLRTQVRYGGTLLYYRGAESPRALARVAVRRVVVDEADKTPASTGGGKEAGAISLARHRLRTVLNSKLYINSTPSTRAGPIWQEWERSDQRYYHVPCPHCGHYHRLEFSHIRWPEGATAEQVEMDELATYHCPACGAAIDAQREKASMLARGRWVASKPTGKHAGFHISALYSPWLTWSQIAVEHLRAATVDQRRDFVNGYLGWIFEEQVDRIDKERLKASVGEYQAGEIPEGVLLLTAGVDCKARDVHYEVRGWGLRGETWLIEAAHIQADDLKAALLEFEERVLKRSWRRGEHVVDLRRVFIDSGYRPRTVARFCRRNRVCKAVAGRAENPGRNIVVHGSVEKTIAGKIVGLPVLLIDVNETQDQIADSMHQSDRWHAPADVPPEWFRHLSAEHAVLIKGKKRWQPIPGAGANHWLDACRYSFAAGYTLGTWTMQDELVLPRAAPKAAAPSRPPEAPSDMRLPMTAARHAQRAPVGGLRPRAGFGSRAGFRSRR